MRNRNRLVFYVAVSLFLTSTFCFAQEDAKGCKDHPLFSRMPGYRIVICRNADYDSADFIDPDSKEKMTIEGRKSYTEYMALADYRNKYSRLQVSRNYSNAIQKIGGRAYEKTPQEPSDTNMKLIKDGKEIWAKLQYNMVADYLYLTVVEKETMVQEVVANAASMASDIHNTGKSAIYGIYFDFDKAAVKSESAPALKEIAKMMQQDPKLKLFVVGHTDNVGGFDYNMRLSQQRADAVVKELALNYKVDAARLKALGVGPAAPVTTNETEEGKAKNRRVELVKQ